jgi:nitrogen-specific signal transduction histidine kinase
MVTLDAMSESVITVDTDGLIDYVNSAAEALRFGPSKFRVAQRILDMDDPAL